MLECFLRSFWPLNLPPLEECLKSLLPLAIVYLAALSWGNSLCSKYWFIAKSMAWNFFLTCELSFTLLVLLSWRSFFFSIQLPLLNLQNLEWPWCFVWPFRDVLDWTSGDKPFQFLTWNTPVSSSLHGFPPHWKCFTWLVVINRFTGDIFNIWQCLLPFTSLWWETLYGCPGGLASHEPALTH